MRDDIELLLIIKIIFFTPFGLESIWITIRMDLNLNLKTLPLLLFMNLGLWDYLSFFDP